MVQTEPGDPPVLLLSGLYRVVVSSLPTRASLEQAMRMPTILHLRSGLLMATLGLSLGAQAVVITSLKNPIAKLSPDQLAQIYLGQSPTFPTGRVAEPLDLQPGSPLRKFFYQKYLRKNRAQVKSHWSGQVFSGRKQPPRVLGTSQEVVKLVAGDPRFIAYVDQSAVDASVKVIKIE